MEKQLTPLHRRLILINVAVSTFMATLDGSIVNIALPVMSRELNVTINSIQWVVTSYLLAISILLLIWGKISDIYGKKKIFAFGFILFTLGSIFCGISVNLSMLVISRILQATGASAMMALSQGIITSTFPASQRGRALGIIGTTVAIGSLVGPSLGGLIINTLNWKAIFFINIPIGIIGTILTFFTIPEIHELPESKEFDFKGSFMFIASILFLFIGLLYLQEGKISLLIFIPLFLTSVILLALFIRFEKGIDVPLINLGLFKIKVFNYGLSSAFLSFVAINSTILFIPFYLQFVLNLSPLNAGLLISFYPVATAIIAPISGRLSDKYGYRILTVSGLLLNTFVLLGLSTLNESSSNIQISILMALLGAGVGMFHSPNNSSIMGSVPRDQLGVAGGINALARNLGMVSGTTLSVLIFSFTTKMNINNMNGNSSLFDTSMFLKGYKIVLIFAAVSCLISSSISLKRAVNIKS